MYMRKPNPKADQITKHVLEYLLSRFTLSPGDINNIRKIINITYSKTNKQPFVEKPKKAP